MLKDFFVAGPYDDGDPVTGHYYETASPDPHRAQVWAYTDRLSYAPGERLALHAMSSAPRARLAIARDGLHAEVLVETEIALSFEDTPADCSVRGCDWPERYALTIPGDWQSGLYTATLTVPGHQSQHMFVLSAARPQARICMVLTTGTWCAYNDWGGSNHYQGLTGQSGGDFAPEVSLHRPWAKGFVRWPEDAPRIPHASPLLSKPRYPHMDYARAKGISKKYASSGWAAFERPFALWCETQGIALDYATQHDLHRDPGLLDGYGRALIVGHDEYWTWEMRDHLDGWLDRGGRLARFAGNFFWQTRLSPDLATQICYKTTANQADPVRDTDPRRLTGYWDDPTVARPATATMGLTGSMGVYAGWSRCAAHGSGGFAIYRPDHWSLRDTGLGYGDVLGAGAKIFGYEVDGIDYTMTHGLPFAAEGTGLEGDLTIVGLSPATTLSHSTGPHDRDGFIGHLDAEEVAEFVYGEVTPESFGRASRGNGCMADYRRGKGAVFNAGSCEWVAGLIARDRTVEQVTRNVLLGDWG
ncbi:N,N-dimethylformamidase beta subunit family domain-containing protein [Frigidibacter sp. SD6-1]|uniref:N,N-dimethylformamidase beta subunit family domain-containing protein n=1 Tax=Frigidibacter sp. SD6-1 TaxID=3032581 RepID=UPI0024DF8839|nr:N,N-dimethylformamidase beta subunit family domain-containing protein [Frigidibacter sp. SD6-1]